MKHNVKLKISSWYSQRNQKHTVQSKIAFSFTFTVAFLFANYHSNEINFNYFAYRIYPNYYSVITSQTFNSISLLFLLTNCLMLWKQSCVPNPWSTINLRWKYLSFSRLRMLYNLSCLPFLLLSEYLRLHRSEKF